MTWASMNRRRALALGGAAAAAAAFSGKASAAPEYQFKFGTSLPSRHIVVVRLTEALQKIEEKTSGRLKIQMFSDGQLGGDQDMLSQVRTGALEFYLTGPTGITSLQPQASIITIPFAFAEHNDAWKAVDGDLGKAVIDTLTPVGLHGFFPHWLNGFRVLTNSVRPIETPKDLEGMKIRVSGSLTSALFKALGASPQVIYPGEMYMALQTKVVDGADNVIFQIDSFNLNEVQTFLSRTNHQWDTLIQCCNVDVWKALPSDLQKVVEEELAAASMRHRQDAYDLEEKLLKKMESSGMKINKPDPAQFREYLQKAGFYSEQKVKYDPELWKLLEKYVGPLV